MSKTENVMDPIAENYQGFVEWCEYLPDEMFCLFVRLTLLFGIPTFLCAFTFAKGCRFLMGQWLACACGIILACTVPLQGPPSNPIVTSWILTISFISLLCLPGILPFLLTPRLGMQRKLRLGFYAFAILLLVTAR
jgi:hypothetical protein